MAGSAEFLLNVDGATDDLARSRLFVVSSTESGAWLHALPISTLGLRLDDDAICVVVGSHRRIQR